MSVIPYTTEGENKMFEIWRNSFGSIEIVQSDMNTLGGESTFVAGGFETWEEAATAAANLPDEE